jgi:type II secretory pathway component GspD/PulD (secretin)
MTRQKRSRDVFASRWASTAVLSFVVSLMWPTTCPAQVAEGEAYQPFAVKNVSAAELEQALQRLAPPGTDIVVDAKTNRILVRGPAATLQAIQSAITALDRPAAPAEGAAAPRSGGPVLKNYPARTGDATALAAWLRSQFTGVADLRIAADQRTAQVLVLATPQLHSQVAQRIEQYPGGAGVSEPAQAAVGAVGQKVLTLRHNTAMQIEAALAKTLGTRLTPNRAGAPGGSNYLFPIAGQQPLDVSINYQTNQVVVKGASPALDSLARLVEALDAPKPGADESLQFVSLKNSKSGDIRRAVSAIQTGSTEAASTQPAERLAMLFQQKAAGGETAAAKPADDKRQQALEK